MTPLRTASLVMAAGRGSRMQGYQGSKTLLPLVPGANIYEGGHPMIEEILRNLPAGPRAIVVHHRQEEVMAATRHLGVSYCRQPELNGTGGALIAAAGFIAATPFDALVVTMGDVPLVTGPTYAALVGGLDRCGLMVLGFEPGDRRRYGLLEIDAGGWVKRITEWAYWRDYPAERLSGLRVCNAGIYAFRKDVLQRFLPVLEARPHVVQKEIDGALTGIKEYFITDLVEYLGTEGLVTGCHVVGDELEVMGVDDPESLRRAQQAFLEKRRP